MEEGVSGAGDFMLLGISIIIHSARVRVALDRVTSDRWCYQLQWSRRKL